MKLGGLLRLEDQQQIVISFLFFSFFLNDGNYYNYIILFVYEYTYNIYINNYFTTISIL